MALTRITADGITDGSILNADINSSAAIALSKLSTSGTASGSTYLRGDGAWSTISSSDSTKMPLAGGTFTGDTLYNDSVKAKFGTGSDFEIYHDGTNNYLVSGTGLIRLRHSSEDAIITNANGAVELYYDNSKKLETTSTGITVTGDIRPTGHIYLGDADVLAVGAGEDLQIWHDSSTNKSIIKETGSGSFDIQGNWVQILNEAGNESKAIFKDDGAVELYHNNVKTFQTSTHGGQFFAPEGGTCQVYFYADEGDDNNDLWGLLASHSSSKFSIDNYAGGGWETSLTCEGNGAVKLFYDDSNKLETTSIGATLTGRLLINNDTHGQYPVEVKNSNGNFIAGIYESSSGDGRHGMFYLNSNGGTNHVKLSANGASYFTSGNVGIGTTTPEEELTIASSNPCVRLNDSTNYHRVVSSSENLYLECDTGNQIADSFIGFRVDGTSEKMRVNSEGHFCVGTAALTTTSTDPGFAVDPDGAIVCRRNGTMVMLKSIGTGGYTAISILSANTQVGSCTFNSGGTSWNTSSDYRLKENQVAISDGITRLKTLKPYRFNFKENPSETVDGFFAHEVSPAVPEAITGTKDAVATDDDAAEHDHLSVGDPIYQQIDQSKLVPLLTAALQEAIGRIEELETKVAALGG